MNQADLRRLAEERLRDAATLLDGQRAAFAYYVAGYSVECALKSCVLARMVYTGGIFRDKKFAEWCWTHDFEKLIDLAGLMDELNVALAESAAAGHEFFNNWATVVQWKETVRYEAKTEAEATAMIAAINHNPHGIMRWLQKYW